MSDPTQGAPVSVTIDEMDAMDAQAQKPDLNQIKVEGDDVPELIRGKSVAEIVKQFGSVTEALKISEKARTDAASAQPAAAASPPPPPEEPDLTIDQINEMYQENPTKAIQAMQEQSDRRANKNLEARLAPLTAGTARQVEDAVRTKYADEFALFGEQITRLAAQIPNGKTVLSNPAAWEDLIAFVRGQPDNFSKLMERKSNPNPELTRIEAQRQQQETGGVTFTGASPRRRMTPGMALDPIQKEIAGKMGLTDAEYIKWSDVS